MLYVPLLLKTDNNNKDYPTPTCISLLTMGTNGYIFERRNIISFKKKFYKSRHISCPIHLCKNYVSQIIKQNNLY